MWQTVGTCPASEPNPAVQLYHLILPLEVRYFIIYILQLRLMKATVQGPVRILLTTTALIAGPWGAVAVSQAQW